MAPQWPQDEGRLLPVASEVSTSRTLPALSLGCQHTLAPNLPFLHHLCPPTGAFAHVAPSATAVFSGSGLTTTTPFPPRSAGGSLSPPRVFFSFSHGSFPHCTSRTCHCFWSGPICCSLTVPTVAWTPRAVFSGLVHPCILEGHLALGCQQKAEKVSAPLGAVWFDGISQPQPAHRQPSAPPGCLRPTWVGHGEPACLPGAAAAMHRAASPVDPNPSALVPKVPESRWPRAHLPEQATEALRPYSCSVGGPSAPGQPL